MNMDDLLTPSEELFEPGQLVATPGAIEATNPESLLILCQRHLSGDWGDICEEDKEQNDEALKLGNRVLSSYNLPEGGKVWVITEWDRSVTTILLPGEY